jgi:flagellum-specific peptidoglycan hydrolase FlgJ
MLFQHGRAPEAEHSIVLDTSMLIGRSILETKSGRSSRSAPRLLA